MRYIVLIALAAAACSKGWPDDPFNAEDPRARGCLLMAATVAGMNGRQIGAEDAAWQLTCFKWISDLTRPCQQYRYGSDEATRCLERRLPEIDEIALFSSDVGYN